MDYLYQIEEAPRLCNAKERFKTRDDASSFRRLVIRSIWLYQVVSSLLMIVRYMVAFYRVDISIETAGYTVNMDIPMRLIEYLIAIYMTFKIW